jgi:hypothetical protein
MANLARPEARKDITAHRHEIADNRASEHSAKQVQSNAIVPRCCLHGRLPLRRSRRWDVHNNLHNPDLRRLDGQPDTRRRQFKILAAKPAAKLRDRTRSPLDIQNAVITQRGSSAAGAA